MGYYTIYIGLAAGCFTALASLPQLLKLWRDKDTKSLSVTTLWVLVAGLGLWVVYGSLLGDLPIVLTNGFSLLVNLLVLVTIAHCRKKQNQDKNSA